MLDGAKMMNFDGRSGDVNMRYHRTPWSFISVFGIFLLTLMFSEGKGAEFNPFEPYQGSLVPGQKTCPGLYCGRVQLLNTDTNDSYGPCEACPRGQRRNPMSICEPCNSEPLFYDWLYIGFMINLSLGLHLFFIDFFSNGYHVLVLHTAAVVECTVATLITLLLMEPKGSPTLHACGVKILSDWYTMLNNPTPDYTRTLHCTQEAVYPLYTVVFVIYTFELLLMMLFRPLLSIKLCKNQGRNSIYAALYFLPLLVLLHALSAGLIYYSFPYILIISSLLMHAIHFAYSEIETPRKLVSNLRNPVILLAHWLCHAYGIIALTVLADPPSNLPLLALVVLPMVFYLSTEQFTEPHRILSNEI